MEDTLIVVREYDDIFYGQHLCMDAPLDYILQSAGDAYNCLVRNNVIKDKNQRLLLICINRTILYTVIVSANDDYSVQSKFENARPVFHNIYCKHNKFKIGYYGTALNYVHDINIVDTFNMALEAYIKSKEEYKILYVKSVIWDKINKENKAKSN